VHRDIKPENIMFSAGSAVVADFGIARALSAATLEPLTAAGVIVGTPIYMSPEQRRAAAARRPVRYLQPRMRGVRDADRIGAVHGRRRRP